MSGSEDQGGAGRREVAYRLFAAEFDDADFSYSESDEERAPNYVVTPSGARVNRLFAVGVLTAVEQAGEDILRARVVDPTGAFVVYAGQYQPDAQAFFERADPPMFVAVTGKARTFQPDDADVIYTSVRPENVNEVTAETRDHWNVQTARQTLDRVATMASALDRDERGDDLRRALEAEGVDVGLAAGIPLAVDHYETTPAYLAALRDLSTQVAEVVAGDRDEVEAFATDPDAPGEADLGALARLDVATSVGGATAETAASDGEAQLASATSDAAASASTGADAGQTNTTDETSVDTDSDTGPGETAPQTETATTATESGAGEAADETPAETDASTVGSGAIDTAADASDEADAPTDDGEAVDAAPTGTADETADDEAGAETGSAGADEVGDFEPGEFELDDDEREAIEEEYGTDFQSGTEVDEPGAADIETPDAEETATETETAAAAATEAEADAVSGTESTDQTTTEDSTETDIASEAASADADATEAESDASGADGDEDVDLETAVMDAMRDNDDGEGASEAAIVETVTGRLGVDAAAVEDAIQDALMGGQCYEPDDGVYKPI